MNTAPTVTPRPPEDHPETVAARGRGVVAALDGAEPGETGQVKRGPAPGEPAWSNPCPCGGTVEFHVDAHTPPGHPTPFVRRRVNLCRRCVVASGLDRFLA